MAQKKKIHNPEETRQAIKDAFTELLKEKAYDEIPVTEIAKRAGINRVTFYYHYDNVISLMEEIETEVADEVVGIIRGLFRTETFHEDISNLFLDVFLSNRQIAVWFMETRTTGKGLQMIYEAARDICIPEWKKLTSKTDAELNRFFEFYFAGTVAFLRRWYHDGLEGNTEKTREEFIALTWHIANYIFRK